MRPEGPLRNGPGHPLTIVWLSSKRGSTIFRENQGVLAEEISCQMGKPIRQSRNEFGGFFERAEHMLGIAGDALAPDNLPKRSDSTFLFRCAKLGLSKR